MKFIQKHWLPILLAIAVVAAVVLNSLPKKEIIVTDNSDAVESVAVPQCYLYEEEVNIDSQDGALSDSNIEFIDITIDKKGIVNGHHYILPSGEDANKAYFVGIAQTGFINVVATSTVGDKTWQEQRVYKVYPEKLLVGYQEIFVPQYKNEKDIYLYEDLSKIKFETEKFFLSRVDCETVDRSKF